MRVVVVGATGNVGTSVVRAFAPDPQIESVVGIARRAPALRFPKTQWVAADVTTADLEPLFTGADAVIHLAWLIQPSRDERALRSTNVAGSARVFEAVARARVPALIYASSVGAYSPGPKDYAVDETWPTEGIASSFYARHKAEVERMLDRFEGDNPHVRVVRLRPALIFKREAASGVRRLFAGPLLPGSLLRPELVPLIPRIERLRFQAVHSYDVGEAYRLATIGDVRGAFNVAADPVLDPDQLAEMFRARTVSVPARVVRAAWDASYRLHLQPTPPGWMDLALGVPLLDSSRAHAELGWKPEHTAVEALADLLGGLREGAGLDTPPLAPGTAGPLRLGELLTGIGRR